MRFSTHGYGGPYASPTGIFTLDQPAAISQMIAALQGTPQAASLPLFRAALAQELVVANLLPGGRVPTRLLDFCRPPTVIVVAGDPSNPAQAAQPPERFPQARRLLAWSAGCMVHGTGGKEAHYQTVVTAAKARRRFLLIETCTAQEIAWLDLVQAEGDRRRAAGRDFPAIVVSARPRGGVHPVTGAAA